jgi:hypothetical protein
VAGLGLLDAAEGDDRTELGDNLPVDGVGVDLIGQAGRQGVDGFGGQLARRGEGVQAQPAARRAILA